MTNFTTTSYPVCALIAHNNLVNVMPIYPKSVLSGPT